MPNSVYKERRISLLTVKPPMWWNRSFSTCVGSREVGFCCKYLREYSSSWYKSQIVMSAFSFMAVSYNLSNPSAST